MLDIQIIAIGKLKEKHYLGACFEYQKRLSAFGSVRIEELKPEPFSKNTQIKAQKLENQRLLNCLSKYDPDQIILLDKSGKELDSISLANYLEKYNQKKIVLVIGGALGFNQELLAKYKNHLSFSKMTFPHELARVILLEQLYRAATIIKKKDYHY